MSTHEESNSKNALLVDQDVQTLIQYMVSKGKYVITPQIGSRGISYPVLSTVFTGRTEVELSDLLERLSNSGLLKSRLFDKVVVCPTCGSAQVFSKYKCPRCDSFDIAKAPIIEHTRCGFIGSRDKFSSGNLLICPKCKKSVAEMEFKMIGTSFECSSCSSRFETPRISHKCSSCDDVFTYKEAKYEPIRVFELSEDVKRSVATGTLPLESILTKLKESGFEVRLRSSLIGKSGATHSFDLIATRDDTLLVANFAFEPKEEDIIGLFAKKYDVNPTFTVLISLSPPSNEEESVSRAYDVKIVSPNGNLSIGEQLVDLMALKSSNSGRRKEEGQIDGDQLQKKQEANVKPRRAEYSFDHEWDQYNF